MNGALGLIEIGAFAPSLVALDALDKSADVRLLQVELNDQLGALIKITGEPAAVKAAVQAAQDVAVRMRVAVVTDVINAPADGVWPVVASPPEFNVLMESQVVFIPRPASEKSKVNGSFALGLIETQGLTAVLEALDCASKAAAVEVVGREKLGGGFVTVIIKGDVAAVQAAVDAGKMRIEALKLGKIVATHVIPRPSEAVLSLLPKS